MRVSSCYPLSLAALALVLSACSAEKAAEDASVAAPRAEADAAGPAIDPASAPGVAFQYAYDFQLPGDAISRVQREHAQACAQLGPARCRVTGLQYEKPGGGAVTARLDLLLAPDLAHAFASDGVAAVEKAAGKVANAHVTGENAADTIALSQSDSASREAEIRRITARLSSSGLTGEERAQLNARLADLRDSVRSAAATRKGLEASLASTPVHFAYASESLVAGKGTFAKAAAASFASLEGLVGVLALVLGVALPWAVLAGVGVLIWRRWRRPRVLPVIAD